MSCLFLLGALSNVGTVHAAYSPRVRAVYAADGAQRSTGCIYLNRLSNLFQFGVKG